MQTLKRLIQRLSQSETAEHTHVAHASLTALLQHSPLSLLSAANVSSFVALLLPLLSHAVPDVALAALDALSTAAVSTLLSAVAPHVLLALASELLSLLSLSSPLASAKSLSLLIAVLGIESFHPDSVVPKAFVACISLAPSLPALQALATLCHMFPGFCKPHATKIEVACVHGLLQSDDHLLKAAISTLVAVSFNTDSADGINNVLLKTTASLNILLNSFLTLLEEDVKITVGSHYPVTIPPTDPEPHLAAQLTCYLRALTHLLASPGYPGTLLSVTAVLAVTRRILHAYESTLDTTEPLLLALLTALLPSVLAVVLALVEAAGDLLLVHRRRIWEIVAVLVGTAKSGVVERTAVFGMVERLVVGGPCGASDNVLDGLVNWALDDVVKLAVGVGAHVYIAKVKRRKVEALDCVDGVCAALSLVNTVLTIETNIPITTRTRTSKVVIGLLLSSSIMRRPLSSRVETYLYAVLATSLFTAHDGEPSSLQPAVRLFCGGLHSASVDVRKVCRDSLVRLEALVHGRVPPLIAVTATVAAAIGGNEIRETNTGYFGNGLGPRESPLRRKAAISLSEEEVDVNKDNKFEKPVKIENDEGIMKEVSIDKAGKKSADYPTTVLPLPPPPPPPSRLLQRDVGVVVENKPVINNQEFNMDDGSNEKEGEISDSDDGLLDTELSLDCLVDSDED
ncbi:hypothetical protein HK096_004557 [Nowakowskiella sp. JEL0078]|nr:hypothetical protein HK096_004557 [Nowakowskiella sp. JEL0078]